VLRRLRSLPQEALVLVALLVSVPIAAYAASNFPAPSFNQVGAGETSGGAALLPQKMDADADGVTGHAVADTAASGTGTLYMTAAIDTQNVTASITTATTTQVAAGTSGQNLYVFYAGFQSTATNSSDTVIWEYGTGTNCGTGTTSLWGGQILTPQTAAGLTTAAFAGGGRNGNGDAVIPAANPYILPAGVSLCVVTAGTTIAGVGVALTAKH